MHRRQLIRTSLGLAAAGALPAGLGACASRPPADPNYPIASDNNAQAYTFDELVAAGSRELGIAAEAVGGAIERIFAEQGDRPTAYIAGEEGAGAVVAGLRYGRGALHMKDLSASQEVFWQAPPSAGTGAATPAGSSPWSTACITPTCSIAAIRASRARLI